MPRMANKKHKTYPDDILFNQQELSINECEALLALNIPDIRKKYGLSERKAIQLRRTVRQTKKFWEVWHELRHHLIKAQLGYTAVERDFRRADDEWVFSEQQKAKQRLRNKSGKHEPAENIDY